MCWILSDNTALDCLDIKHMVWSMITAIIWLQSAEQLSQPWLLVGVISFTKYVGQILEVAFDISDLFKGQLIRSDVFIQLWINDHLSQLLIIRPGVGEHLHTFMCCHPQASPCRSKPKHGYLYCEIMTPYHRYSFKKAILFTNLPQTHTLFAYD